MLSAAQRTKLRGMLRRPHEVFGVVERKGKYLVFTEAAVNPMGGVPTFHTHNKERGYKPPSRRDMFTLLQARRPIDHYVVTHTYVYRVEVIQPVAFERAVDFVRRMHAAQQQLPPGAAYDRWWLETVNTLMPDVVRVTRL